MAFIIPKIQVVQQKINFPIKFPSAVNHVGKTAFLIFSFQHFHLASHFFPLENRVENRVGRYIKLKLRKKYDINYPGLLFFLFRTKNLQL